MSLLGLKVKIHKLFHWEYWHARWIYLPLIPLGIYLTIRNRSLVFFNNVNPSFSFGGLVMTPKSQIYDLIDKNWIPKTKLVSKLASKESIEEEFDYPLVVKPNIGLKGLGVYIVNTTKELQTAIASMDDDYLVQDKIPYQNEVGIFYVRFPSEKDGFCTGMVRKDFLKLSTDGVHTLKDLILKDSRAFVHYKHLFKTWKEQLEVIYPKGKELLLVPFGSHTRGATFIDVSNQLTPLLEQKINSICKTVPGFHFGRLDIMYKDWGTLLKGEDFSIVEINGAASEPTFIYDPKHTYIFALKHLAKHWLLMSRVSRQNKSNLKSNHSFKSSLAAISKNVALEKQLRKTTGLK